ncbi:hypothetical protein EUX98_g8304 [Antrodiella citrinella]|uniref:Uncharacterized protein n=1 Tax=Antrodiella citrinella TaxID=2447956 RepID=A0A4S4M925_9APHY|nr:hypothetical protein EUX98_g8304 [Antrodiella citrinella]
MPLAAPTTSESASPTTTQAHWDPIGPATRPYDDDRTQDNEDGPHNDQRLPYDPATAPTAPISRESVSPKTAQARGDPIGSTTTPYDNNGEDNEDRP